MFHNVVPKSLFVANCSRLDILPTVSVLSGRFHSPNQNNWEKCGRMVNYLNSTKKLNLILWYDGLNIAQWYVDTSFAVHSDFKIQSGGVLLMVDSDGAITSGRSKQKLTIRSSTETELVAFDNI